MVEQGSLRVCKSQELMQFGKFKHLYVYGNILYVVRLCRFNVRFLNNANYIRHVNGNNVADVYCVQCGMLLGLKLVRSPNFLSINDRICS